MKTFIYEGADKNGNPVRQSVEAENRFDVYELARKEGYTVSKVIEGNKTGLFSWFDVEKINYALGRVKKDEIVSLTKSISSMLKAGLPLTRALSVVERQSKNVRLKGTMISIREDLSGGKQFNESLIKFPKIFSPLYVAMVRAGEEGGQLSEALSILGMQLERTALLKKKVKGAMIYPAIVISAMVIIGVLMMIYVVPTITATFTSMNVDLPATTQILITTSTLLSEHSIFVFSGFFLFVLSMYMGLRTTRGKRLLDYVVTHLPVIGVIAKELNAARTARTLSSLLSSGVDVLGAIKITEDVVQNSYYKDILKLARSKVEKGSPLSETFIAESGYYPVLVGEMIAVGEETGQIAGMLHELAEYYEREIDQKTKDLSTIIEPLLMVVIGGSVGFFALAMIAPIYSISDTI